MVGVWLKSGAAAAAITLALAIATTARAQPAFASVTHAAPPAALNLSPLAAGTGDPYDLSAQVAPDPLGPTPEEPAAPAPPRTFLPDIHGVVAAGVGSRGTREVGGAVSIPLVPGRADLAVGGTIGRLGSGLSPYGPAAKLSYSDYFATLHLHPSDDLDASLTIAGASLHAPAGWGR